MKRASNAVITVLALAALLPAGAVAKPGFHKFPASRVEQVVTQGANGYTIVVILADRVALLSALRSGPDGDTSITYERRHLHPHGNDFSLDLGRAGDVHARFVPGTVEKSPPFPGCSGGPSIVETGQLVGAFDFRAEGGITSLHRHRLRVTVTREPTRFCHEPGGDRAATRRLTEEDRELIAGTPSGDVRFTATTYPSFSNGGPSLTLFSAESRRRENGLVILDSTRASLPATTFAVPRLDGLPATSTVELPAPFTGSATFDLPSRQTATVSGDLRADLPEVGETALTDPGTDAGVCLGYECTGSLPDALRPSRDVHGFFFATITEVSAKPAS